MTQVNHHLDRRLDAARHQMWQMQQQLMSCQAACATVTAQNAHLRFVVQAYEESLLVRTSRLLVPVQASSFDSVCCMSASQNICAYTSIKPLKAFAACQLVNAFDTEAALMCGMTQ